MRMTEFISNNRETLNQAILEVQYRHDGRGGRGIIPNPPPQISIAEIKEWIANDEGLYHWAKSEGVRV